MTETNKILTEISSCEVCGNTQLKEVLDLGDHAMCDDLIPVKSKCATTIRSISTQYI